MFTGIVEELGTIRAIRRGARSCALEIEARRVLADVQVGDSVAVNGVCLTATSVRPAGFTADVMPETLDRSSLAQAHPGTRVNLERAMAAGGRFGGHIVAGHVDGVGTIARLERDDNAVWLTVHATPAVTALVVEKGSIAIDGVSLTVARLDAGADTFAVSIIPHTFEVTALGLRRVGDLVNLETDVIGKYVARLLGLDAASRDAPSAAGASATGRTGRPHAEAPACGIDLDLLASAGFL